MSPFAPVKSDPWLKGKITRRVFQLWPTTVWSKLVDAQWVRSEQLRIITRANYDLYGIVPHDRGLLR